MEEFLKTVANHYKQKSISEVQLRSELASLPLSHCLFCFPNRRSGLFFSRYLREAFGTVCFVPTITTISELYGQFSSRQVIDRTALLFRLYQCYAAVMAELFPAKEVETFDQFVFWGDMILADFEDVDKYLVDADHCFANIKDLKEIDLRFAGLSAEQIEIIRSFWHSFRPEQEYPEGEKHTVFGQTWAILEPLYHRFKETLAADNMAYEGMMEREVYESLKARIVAGEQPFSKMLYKKVVFVGLTAISKVDREFMKLLQLSHLAEFCWDYADSRLRADSELATSAAFFTKDNLSDFPNEIPDQVLNAGLVPESQRKVELYSIASGVGQTTQARQTLLEWMNEAKEKHQEFDPIRTAVVLPDEKLLLPMLYAMPKKADAFNVTMGYSLKFTPISAFIDYLAELNESWKESTQSFYFRQVLPVLSHSFTIGMAGEKARCLSEKITKENLYQVPVSLFADDPFLSLLFSHTKDSNQTLSYLTEVLRQLMQYASINIGLKKEEEEAPLIDSQMQLSLDFDQLSDADSDLAVQAKLRPVFTDIDYEFLYHYNKTLKELQVEISKHQLSFKPRTLYLLLNKLIAGVSVPFSGEPLKGIQVMGVLETRSLDFENVIILSMNEGVFPAKPVQNTFIPMSLRDAFGIPTQRHRDSVFAYHFFRLISRAKRLTMIYDSRSEGMQSGEESRYVKQLRCLMGHPDLKAKTVDAHIPVLNAAKIIVNKTPEIMAQLEAFRTVGSKQNLSASALKNYIKCPLKFYLSTILHLREDDEVSEGVDSSVFGSILHLALELLFMGSEGVLIQSSALDRYANDDNQIVTKAIYQAFYEVLNNQAETNKKRRKNNEPIPQAPAPEGYNLIVATILRDYALSLFRHDKTLCPFTYLVGENKQYVTYQVEHGFAVNFVCIYDRLDLCTEEGADVLRIVDYKTGKSDNGKKLQFASVDQLFSPECKGSLEAFQVMLYSLLITGASAYDLKNMRLSQVPKKIAPHLYFVRDFARDAKKDTHLQSPQFDKKNPTVTDFSPYCADFRNNLDKLLREIFDPQTPFEQCKDTNTCTYCSFKQLCKRI